MKLYFVLLLAALAGTCLSCKHEAAPVAAPPDSRYPPEVGKILLNKCATAGCHNAASYQVSGGGLLLDSWDHLFSGGNTGAAVVAYSPENSPLLYFTNSYPDLGPLPDASMKMPFNGAPLTREECLTLRDWVRNGAPDRDGNIPFATNAATRQKIYLAHQGCDYITVIDAERNVIMRCVPTGKEVTIEVAYSLSTSPDGFAYVSFWASQYVMKVDTRTDTSAGGINIGNPNSHMLHVLPTSNELLLTNAFSNSLLRIDPLSGQVLQQYGNGTMSAPHGVAGGTSGNFYVAERYGNTICKISPGGAVQKISIDGNPPSTAASGPNPYSLVMAPDDSRYFIACTGTHEIRVMDAHSDTLIATIPVGTNPQGLALSRSKPYLFVTCEDDSASLPRFRGSVYIIDRNTYQVVRKIDDRYYMPHALAVDDVNGKLFVFSRNIDPDGPTPHHQSSACSGRNGYYSVYDFNALQPVNNKRYEVTVDPFAADARFR